MQIHIHGFPSCGTKCNTSCSQHGAEMSCNEITQGINRGKYLCVHAGLTPGVPWTLEDQFIKDLANRGIIKTDARINARQVVHQISLAGAVVAGPSQNEVRAFNSKENKW
jgi:hypothetical protein